MQIYYGIFNNKVDVTDICLSQLTNNNILTIPKGDGNRAIYFKDHLPGIHKLIFIYMNDIMYEYDEYIQITIDVINNTIKKSISLNDINNKIIDLHSKLKIKYGSFNDELPEQKMAVRYLTGDEKVLEIGGNIGRNSLIIASILKNNANFVTLESDTYIAKQLTENRDLNNFNFHIESSALSNRKLIQSGWNTIPSDTLLKGYSWVNTISLDKLKTKYNIEFDTLVLDCEGAFYYILMDMPNILDNINLIIMENDYNDKSHKVYINKILRNYNFNIDYSEGGGWGPCQNFFFEVWKK
jgi:FkbM family methyltransferase